MAGFQSVAREHATHLVAGNVSELVLFLRARALLVAAVEIGVPETPARARRREQEQGGIQERLCVR